MTSFNTVRVIALAVLLSLAASVCLSQPIASGDLEIRGMALEIVETSVSVQANLGTPSYVQTRFGGRTDDAQVVEGLVAEGDLVGPDIASPITLRTAPGHRFEIPGLGEEGDYYLQNVRLVRDGEFVTTAIPSVAVIHVSNTLRTEVKVRQLTAEELRERGIVVDLRNFEVYGRTTRIAEADAAAEFGEFDLLGRPRLTRTIRYKETGCIPSIIPCGTGLTTGEVAEVYTQGHEWSVFADERDRWRMPVAGIALPGSESESPWRNWIVETRDAGANVTLQREAVRASASPLGLALSQSAARGAGRIAERKRGVRGSLSEIVTRYAYSDQPEPAATAVVPVVPPAPGPATGTLGRVETIAGSRRIAGSEILLNAKMRIGASQDLGLSSRQSSWEYDERARLTTSVLLQKDGAIASQPRTENTIRDAGLLAERDVSPPRMGTADLGILGIPAARAVVPFSWTADAPASAHRITKRTFDVSGLPAGEQSFAWEGGRRTSDGSWLVRYDPRGRLTIADNVTEGRRLAYDYDPNDRLVGRTALQAAPDGAWLLETRSNVLARDGLPAETSYVWDSVTDRLVAVYDSAAVRAASCATAGCDASAGLLRQFVHGDQAYDDPVEVLVAPAAGAAPRRWLPVIDEAGAGSLQAVLDDEGNLVERVLYADAYGDEPRYLQGAVVEQIRVERTSSGDARTITLEFTEPVDASTLESGVRLAIVGSDGAVLRTSSVAPAVADESRIVWSFGAAEWQDFIAAPAGTSVAIQLAVGPGLRFTGWGSTELLPPAGWEVTLGRAASSSGWPFIKTVAVSQFDATATLYDIPDLYLVGRAAPKSGLQFDFHALPFRDPALDLIYVRARWYDPSTGSFLTPDPMGYEDASNLYAYAGNDPVNFADASGMMSEGGWDSNEWFFGDVQRGAEQVGEVLSNPYVQGGLQVLGGCTEAALGIGAVATGAGAVPGAVAIVHGGDICITGVRTLATGKNQDTLFMQGARGLLKKTGMSEENAELLATGVDMLAGGYGTAGSMKALSRARTMQRATRATRATRETEAADEIAYAGRAVEASASPTDLRTPRALIGPANDAGGKSLNPVVIEFRARGLTKQQQALFRTHLAEQEAALNAMPPADLELNLLNYRHLEKSGAIKKSRSLASRRLGRRPFAGAHAAHRLDAVAGGYLHDFAGYRDPVQAYIGSIWKLQRSLIQPGRQHVLVPKFTN